MVKRSTRTATSSRSSRRAISQRGRSHSEASWPMACTFWGWVFRIWARSLFLHELWQDIRLAIRRKEEGCVWSIRNRQTFESLRYRALGELFVASKILKFEGGGWQKVLGHFPMMWSLSITVTYLRFSRSFFLPILLLRDVISFCRALEVPTTFADRKCLSMRESQVRACVMRLHQSPHAWCFFFRSNIP